MKQKAYYLVTGLTLLGLLSVYGIYTFSKQQINSREGGNSSYVVNTSNSPSISPTPYSAGPSGFLLESSGSAKLGQTFTVKLLVRSDTDAANLFSAKLSFPKDQIEVVNIDPTDSIVKLWADKVFDNKMGTVSIIGGIPNPGFKTNPSDKPALLATIIFKANLVGNTTISFLSSSQVFRNSDNQNILNLTQPIVVNITK